MTETLESVEPCARESETEESCVGAGRKERHGGSRWSIINAAGRAQVPSFPGALLCEGHMDNPKCCFKETHVTVVSKI